MAVLVVEMVVLVVPREARLLPLPVLVNQYLQTPSPFALIPLRENQLHVVRLQRFFPLIQLILKIQQ
jgi:hypothetical protein